MDSGSVTEEATISTDANGGLIFGGNSGPGELIFKTSSGTERVRITSAGNVGIGTGSPSELLDVAGDAKATRLIGNQLMESSSGVGSDTFSVVGGTSSNLSTRHGAVFFSKHVDSYGLLVGTHDATFNSFVVKGNGNVGIGTTSPNEKLTISSGAISFLGDISTPSIGAGLFRPANNTLAVVTGSTERMRIENNGEVGIGTTVSRAQLEVVSPNLASTRDALRLKNAVTNTGGYFIRFENSTGGVAGYVEQTGQSAVAYRTSSDHRLKENVVDLNDATTRIKQLQPKRFNFITEPDITLDGFLAHEVQSVVPEAISGTHNEVDADGNPVYQGIDQSKLVPLLVKTIQELEARIVALETA
jgi:hypothetical protein